MYDVTVAATDTAGYTINNTSTVNNPGGPGASPAAPTVTVLQSQIPASGNKVLYVYDNLSLTRTPQTGTGAGAVNITSQGATKTTFRAEPIMEPHSACGYCAPRPMNDSAATSRMGPAMLA